MLADDVFVGLGRAQFRGVLGEDADADVRVEQERCELRHADADGGRSGKREMTLVLLRSLFQNGRPMTRRLGR